MSRSDSTGYSSLTSSLALAVGVLVAFWPTLSCGFLSIDDPDYVTSNSHVRGGLSLSGLVWALTTFHSGNWHPVTWLSHMLDAELFGNNPATLHLVNLLLHMANALLLFFLLRRLTGAHWKALLTAGLFALHPLRVESVAWISERKDVLSAFFALLTLVAYSRYAAVPKTQHVRGNLSYLFSLGCFAVGLMSKPMLVTLPFVLLLLDYWPLRRFGEAQPEKATPLRGLIAEKVPFFLLSTGCSVMTLLAQRQAGAIESLDNFPMLLRLQNGLVSCGRYVGKSLWPMNLAMPYPMPQRWPMLLVIIAPVFLAVWVIAALRCARKMPFFLVGSFWFLGMLVPVLGLVQVGGQSMADRYTYVPQIGLWLALVWTSGELALRWQVPKLALGAATGLALAACGFLTHSQAKYWRNSETLLIHTLAVTRDNFLAYYDLGADYDCRGLTDAAIKAYRTALEIQPQFIRAQNNLAADLLARGQWEEASVQYREVLRLDPGLASAHNNYGATLVRQRRFSEAIESYATALRLNPDYGDAHYNLALVLALQRRFNEAVPHYIAAARVEPRAVVFNNLGYALTALGRIDEGVEAYRKAIQLDPTMAESHSNLGNALAQKGDLSGAVEAYRKALRTDSNNPSILNNMGHALAREQDYTAAIANYEAALSLEPGFALAHYNIAEALMAEGHPELAAGHYQQVLAQDGSNALAEYGLARALHGAGQREEALNHARQALRLKPASAEIQELVGKLELRQP